MFGIDKQKMVLRAIERILAGPKSEKFNSLGITRVISVGSGRFPLVRYVTVSAQPRHIQESLFLCHAKDFPKPETEEMRALQPKHRNCERQDTAFTRADEAIQCGIDLESVIP